MLSLFCGFYFPLKSENQFIPTDKLKTDYTCEIKLRLVHFQHYSLCKRKNFAKRFECNFWGDPLDSLCSV